ncbi:MAG: hypothetical protein U0414_06340 [Polyangiaceae bacterium]
MDAKQGLVSILFGANRRMIVVTVQDAELVANPTTNVTMPFIPIERPRCSLAKAWSAAIEIGADGSNRISMYVHPDRRGKVWQIDDGCTSLFVSTASCDPM